MDRTLLFILFSCLFLGLGVTSHPESGMDLPFECSKSAGTGNETTLQCLYDLKEFAGIPGGSFRKHYYFSSYSGSDSNDCSAQFPCQSAMKAHMICNSYTRCTFKGGEHWAHGVLTMDAASTDPGFIVGETVTWPEDAVDAADNCAANTCTGVVQDFDPVTRSLVIHTQLGDEVPYEDYDGGGAAVAATITGGSSGTVSDVVSITDTLAPDGTTYPGGFMRFHASDVSAEAVTGNMIVTITGHNLSDGDSIVFDTVTGDLPSYTGPTQLAVLTAYYVHTVAADAANEFYVCIAGGTSCNEDAEYLDYVDGGTGTNMVRAYQQGGDNFPTPAGYMNPDCDDNSDGLCTLFEGSDYDNPAVFEGNDISWAGTGGFEFFIIQDDSSATGGWIGVQNIEVNHFAADSFSTSQSPSGGGKMILLNTKELYVYNINSGPKSNNCLTAHYNGWIVSLNTECNHRQDSNTTTGSPLAWTGTGGSIVIGQSTIIDDVSGSAFDGAVWTADGGDHVIIGHGLKGIVAANKCKAFYIAGGTVNLQVARVFAEGEAGDTMTLQSGTDALDVKLHEVTMTGYAGLTVVPTAHSLSLTGAGILFDEVTGGGRVLTLGAAVTSTDTINLSYVEADPGDAGNLCLVGAATRDTFASCETEVTGQDSDWTIFGAGTVIDADGTGSWISDAVAGQYTTLPQYAIHPDRAGYKTSIGSYTITFPGQEGGYIPKWVLGTSSNITSLQLDGYVGAR